jgi:hypothetical protein
MATKKYSASQGDSPADELESSFFQLAFQQLQDKLKNLLPHLVGFEIVNKNDEGTKAVGVFGLKSSTGKVLFIPAFFINGTVKGLDLLYAKDSEQFFPLNEDFCEMLLGNTTTEQGRKSDETRQDILSDMSALDMRNMVVPPRTGKYTYASANEELVYPTFHDLVKASLYSPNHTILDYVKNSNIKTKKIFNNCIEKDAQFCEALLRYYPLEKIADSLMELPGKEYRKPEQVQILNEGEAFNSNNLNEAEKEQLATKGFLIIDNRDETKKSKFAPVNLALKFTNPTDTGFYPYLTDSGEIRYGLIIVRPSQLNLNFAIDDAIVVDLSENRAYLEDLKKVFVKDQIVVENYKDVYEKFENPADVKPSFEDVYILINDKLKATQPFRIIANFKDGSSGLRRLKVEPYSSYDSTTLDHYGTKPVQTGDRPGSVHRLPDGNYYRHPKKPVDHYFIMTKSIGDKFTHKGHSSYVPAGFKLLKLEFGKPFGEGSEEWHKGKPGGPSALNAALYERNVYPMTVQHNGSEYFVNVKDVNRTYKDQHEAKIGMVREMGLDWKEACEVIESIKPAHKVQGYLKVADLGSYPAQPYEEVPYIDEFGHPTYQGIGSENQAPIDHSYNLDPTRMGLGVKPEVQGIDGDINKAVQLAENGQKEIFDSHTISTLSKYVSPSDKINEYTPTLLSALDKLGRLLFLVHWEVEKFTEMYGRDDMPKFVEMLTDVFRNLGDTIIFLKRKSPELTINMSRQDALDV